MDVITDILIGVGLAMDASAVSMAGGASRKKGGIVGAAVLAALFFGAFQALMLFMGGIGGEGLKDLISGIDHWLAFGLLTVVGGKMILESRQPAEKRNVDLLDWRVLTLLALATSIDALAVGVGIAFTGNSLLQTAMTVGIITAGLSFASVFLGGRYGHLLENKAEAAGGIVLILIGLKILAEQTALA